MTRPTIDEVLMESAWLWSRRATCSRLSVGAILVKDTRTIATGYNGAPSGMPHCNHWNSDDPCSISVHAEANTLAFAAKKGISTEGATMYVTHAPCAPCARLMVNAGIAEVVWQDVYKSSAGIDVLVAAGVAHRRPF